MFKRLFFLLGLLCGAAALFHRRLPTLPSPPAAFPDLRDFLPDALLLCDSVGTIVEANAAAHALLGASLSCRPSAI